MTDEVSLPARLGPGATLDDLVRTVAALQDWIETREPTSFGGRLNKFLTVSDTVQAGLLSYRQGGTASGVAGDSVAPGPVTSNPDDASQPTPASGLTVAAGVGSYMVEITAPTYLQGGGNGRTIIYSANYSGAGPLPTFGDAAQAGTIPGQSTILVVASEPGVQTHFWAKAETRHPTLQATPTGGTNGVTATADLIENQHVANLSAAKLIAGSIGVGEYIQSTGFISGSTGWQIKGDGVAEFSGVVVRGTLYATAGEIGGLTVNGALTMNSSGHIKGGQTAYNTGTGFFLGYSGAAYKFSIGNGTLGLTWDGSALNISGNLTVGASPAVSGATMTGTGAVLNAAGTFAMGNSSKNISFDGSTLTMNGELVVTGNVAADNITTTAHVYDTTYWLNPTGNVLTYSITLAEAGDIIIIWSAQVLDANGFEVSIDLNGAQVGGIGFGTLAMDGPVAIGSGTATSGSNTIDINWDSGAAKIYWQRLIILGRMR